MTIVEQILASGVKGRRGDCKACIVARFMQHHGFPDVIVGRYNVNFGDCWWSMPDDVYHFALDFDRGQYPDLEDR
jgi:hypothetical protein